MSNYFDFLFLTVRSGFNRFSATLGRKFYARSEHIKPALRQTLGWTRQKHNAATAAQAAEAEIVLLLFR